MTLSVIIPTLNAGKELTKLIDMIDVQSVRPDEIIVVDSASEDETVDICRKNDSIRLIQIDRKDFDHGRTRDMALKESIGDIVIFLTQDAIPADSYLIQNLIKPILIDDTIALSTGRQLPKSDASYMERFVRDYNYPEKSRVRSKEDIEELGIKTFFCSDVCCAYNRKVYYELGGFDYPIKTNEDMFFAAKVINAGYRISYTANAMVYHSHNLTLKEQYKRNFIQGYEIEKRKELLAVGSVQGEGMKLVRYVSGRLLAKWHILSFIRFFFDCCARKFGHSAGVKAYRKEQIQ